MLLLAFYVSPDSVDSPESAEIDTMEDRSQGYVQLIEVMVRGIYWTADKRPGALGFFRFGPDDSLISYSIPSDAIIWDKTGESGTMTQWMGLEEDGIALTIDEPWISHFLILNKRTGKYTVFVTVVLTSGDNKVGAKGEDPKRK